MKRFLAGFQIVLLSVAVISANLLLFIPVKAGSDDSQPVATKFTVSFYSNNKIYASVDVENEDTCREQAPPEINDPVFWEEDALFFSGWFEQGANQAFDFSSPITGSLNLYARFSSKYIVIFKDTFGAVIDTCFVIPGSKLTATQKDASTFGGDFVWVLEGGTDKFDFNTEINSNITLTPFVEGPWLVYFISEGTPVMPQAVKNQETALNPTAPTRSGWTFSYWALGSADGPQYSFNTPVTRHITLYAVWSSTTVRYSVALWLEKPNFYGDPEPGNLSDYNCVGSLSLTGKSGAYTDSSLFSAEIEKLFNGTSSSPTDLLKYAEFQSVESKPIQGDGSTVINLYAKRKVYTYSFDLGSNASRTMVFNGSMYRGNNINKYEFKAKYDEDIYALFPVSGLAVFSQNFSSWSRPSTMTWSDSSNFASPRQKLTRDMISQNGQITSYFLTANWDASGNTYKYRYLAEALPGQTYTTENSIVLNEKTYIIMDNFSFNYQGNLNAKAISGLERVTTNWSSGGTTYQWAGYNYNEQTGFTKNNSTATSVFRCFFYNRLKSNFIFEKNKPGSAYENIQNFPSNSTIMFEEQLMNYTPFTDPVLPGYEFCGWYRDADGLEEFDFIKMTMTSTDITVYAKWKIPDYIITFYDDINGESTSDTQHKPGGSQIDFNSAEWETGDFVEGKGWFVGWYQKIDLESGSSIYLAVNHDLSIHQNINLYAKWKNISYTVKYDAGAGSGEVPVDPNLYYSGMPVPVAAGSTLVPPASNAVFSGWKTDGEETMYYPGSGKIIDGDITLVACYSYFYNVTYDGGGSTGGSVPLDSKIYFSGENVVVRDNGDLTKKGFSFLCWTLSENTEIKYNADDKISIKSNIMLSALWEELPEVEEEDPKNGVENPPSETEIPENVAENTETIEENPETGFVATGDNSGILFIFFSVSLFLLISCGWMKNKIK